MDKMTDGKINLISEALKEREITKLKMIDEKINLYSDKSYRNQKETLERMTSGIEGDLFGYDPVNKDNIQAYHSMLNLAWERFSKSNSMAGTSPIVILEEKIKCFYEKNKLVNYNIKEPNSCRDLKIILNYQPKKH